MKFTIIEDKFEELLDKVGQDKLDEVCVALRSGKYKQHREEMFPNKENIGSAGCCLHVVSMEVDKCPPESEVYFLNDLTSSMGAPASISLQPVSFAMFDSRKVAQDSMWGTHTFADLNDFYLTHPQIADLIEFGEVNIEDDKWKEVV